MTRDEARKLLGGYATGTLTPEEQSALFAAALDDQELFDELAREQALRDLLADPAARGHLLEVLDEPKPEPWYRRRWIFAPLAVAIPAVAVLVVLMSRPAPPKPTTVAILEAPSLVPRLPEPIVSTKTDAAVDQAPSAKLKERPVSQDARAKRAAVPGSARTEGSAATPAEARKDDAGAEAKERKEDKDLKKEAEAAAPVAEAPKIVAFASPRERDAKGSANGVIGGVLGAARGGANSPAAPGPSPPPALAAAAPPQRSAMTLFFAGSPADQLADSSQANKAAAESNQEPVQNQSPQNQQNAQPPSAQQSQIAGARQQLRVVTATGAVQQALPASTGVRYAVVRRDGRGQYVPVSELSASDTAAIRLTPNARGHITVSALGGAEPRVILSTDVAPLATYITSALRPGETSVSVLFTRQSQSVFRQMQVSNLVETAPDQTTYVVNPQTSPPAAEVTFTITLKYK